MAKLTMGVAPGAAQSAQPVSQPAPLRAAPPAPASTPQQRVGNRINTALAALGSIEQVRTEIADAYADAKTFLNLEPDEVMRMCSGHSARLNEIRILIAQVQDIHREWRSVGNNEVEPTIDEIWKQYQMASRLQSVRELDWKMVGGAPS